MIKKFEAFDQSADDFQTSRGSVIMLLDRLIEEYNDFTSDVSPSNWRTTGHHLVKLREMKEDILRFKPISVEEKDIDWVKQSREENKHSIPPLPKRGMLR